MALLIGFHRDLLYRTGGGQPRDGPEEGRGGPKRSDLRRSEIVFRRQGSTERVDDPDYERGQPRSTAGGPSEKP